MWIPGLLAAVVVITGGPPPVTAADASAEVARVGAEDRVATAVAVSRHGWARADVVLLATAADYPDALAAGPLAARFDAPLLLTSADHLPDLVAGELERLGAGEVVIVGGTAAVSDRVARAAAALDTAPAVRRVAGADRYATAAAAAAGAAGGSEAVVASGTGFADAVAAGAVPDGDRRLPVLLTAPDELPAATAAAVEEHAAVRVLVAGGTAAVTHGVADALARHTGAVQRFGGRDRYDTAALLLTEALRRSTNEPQPLVVASGDGFPDALAAGAFAARAGGLLLTVPTTRLIDELDGLLRTHRGRFSHVTVVGGPAAVGPHVVHEIAAALHDRPRPTSSVATPAGFSGVASPLPADVRARMEGVSWRDGCPLSLDELAYLDLDHIGFDGRRQAGEMVVAAAVAEDVLGVFAALHDARFPIERMRLVDDFGADDHRSMDANNTSAFNCRPVEGGTRWSEHAFGTAIDINPVQNPYRRGDVVLPEAGRAYLDRSDVRPGMIVRPGPVVDAFAAIGWGWGGDWQSLDDWMHFSASGH